MTDFELSRQGEVKAIDFVTPEHWDEVRKELAEAEVDLSVFEGPNGGILEIRQLAIRGIAATNPVWKQAVNGLFDRVDELSQRIGQAGYGFMDFGPAIINRRYIPPTIKEVDGGTMTIWHHSSGPRFYFLNRNQLLDQVGPETGLMPVRSLAVVLQYREYL